MVSVLLPPKWLEEYKRILEPRKEEVQIFVAEKEILEKLTGFSMYQGILGVAKIPEHPALETVFQASAPPRLWAAVDGISNSENMGALIRNCAAFGVQALLLGETCSSPYMRRSVRTSMGTVFKLPVVECENLALTLEELRARNIHTVVAHLHANRRTLSQATLAGDTCIVFGSEGNGVSEAVLKACAEAVVIPMALGVDSLNVGSAAAVFLYEAYRQRGKT